MKKVAEYLMVDKSITTRTVGTLIDTGYVKNESEDARQYCLTLTEEGERTVNIIEESLNDLWEELLSDLTEQEREIFRYACIKINNKMKEEAE